MTTPPYLTTTWTDPETGCQGHVVIDRLVRGAAGGGLRMRPGCTLAEVGDLARAMTRKEALAYVPGDRYFPLGGAKGGIDFDPYDPRAEDVLGRFVEAMLPLLQTRWAAGEDLGVRQDDLDALARRAGLRSTVDAALRLVDDGADAGLARVAAGFAAADRGIGLGDLVGGYGVAQASLAALARIGRPVAGATAVVQGFGSMGGATARYLADAGVRVVAVADLDGLVRSDDGLDVEALLRARDRHGRLDRGALGAGVERLPREAWSSVPCDVLVPAATSYAIDDAVARDVRAAVVVEAANVATLPDAERLLAQRGVPVVPDVIANLATNAWWWWVLFGDIEPTVDASFDRIGERMQALVDEAFHRAAETAGTLREAAREMADDRAASAAGATAAA